MVRCKGCQEEMNECYEFQSAGYDSGLDWNLGHCYVFVLNKKGELVLW